uniref:TTC28 C-terminal domain-containing protein n=1 Tax=Timema genevievae TaxID=629358 RepID=A0A7R9K3H1_TIMGE|nr:unnamed protein product [Timema genevievae]
MVSYWLCVNTSAKLLTMRVQSFKLVNMYRDKENLWNVYIPGTAYRIVVSAYWMVLQGVRLQGNEPDICFGFRLNSGVRQFWFYDVLSKQFLLQYYQGFDLMEVGQDEVTLRTGKQANRRNIQFVLQALLALFDTQEAPKSLSLESSSSLESLTSLDGDEEGLHGIHSRSPPVVHLPHTMIVAPHPPLPFGYSRPALLPGHRSSGGAFTSYVRRRGEPDGRTACAGENGVTTVPTKVNLAPTVPAKVSLAPTVNKIVSRPGGGGESDAAFTPSPPVTLQQPDTSSCIATLTLAHQARIRNLYNNGCDSLPPPADELGDSCVPHGVYHRRPDSSSSASSVTDWEGNGHLTVLRRTGQLQSRSTHPLPPPLPPPRQSHAVTHPPPLVDSLHPLPPLSLYNNVKNINFGFESHSSDSDFGGPVETMYQIERTNTNYINSSTLKISTSSCNNINESSKLQPSVIDRLSVRTELSGLGIPISRKSVVLSQTNETSLQKGNVLDASLRLHYFSLDSQEDGVENHLGPVSKGFEEASDDINPVNSASSLSTNDQRVAGNSIQDQIIATQLRRLNQELTPTISDVYHERNIGLGLAPPLSKFELSRRDEGDGRSIADSQCSAGSYKKLCNNTGNSVQTSSLYFDKDICEPKNQPRVVDKVIYIRMVDQFWVDKTNQQETGRHVWTKGSTDK